MNLRRIFATTFGLGAVAHGLAALGAKRIRSRPDSVRYEDLCEAPTGEERFVLRPDGTQIRVRSEGSGPTVVLVHGYGVSLQVWNLVWTQLRQRGCRCVAFDLRGHGRSTIGTEGIGAEQLAGDYAAVFEALDLDDAVLVGHSTGGFLAMRAMLDDPSFAERVRGFVPLASLAGEVMRGSVQNRLQQPLIGLGLLQALAGSETYGVFFAASLCGDSPSPAMIRAFNEVFFAQDHERLHRLIGELAKESHYDRLHQLGVPTVVVCGESDRSTPRWHSEQLGVRIPSARNVWVPGKGHLINWEAPEVVVEAVESLLRSV